MAPAAAIDSRGLVGDHLRRRLTSLMLFRVLVIGLVLGSATLLYWLADLDLASPRAISLYGTIAVTYVLTILYALALKRLPDGPRIERLAKAQLAVDLVIAGFLVHVTGGAQSAYSFFFPLTVIGAAVVSSRRTTAAIAAVAAVLFLAVGILGWAGVLPAVPGSELMPASLTTIELLRALFLNLAAIVAISVLSLALSGQLLRASTSLAVERTVAADLLTLHRDVVQCLPGGLVTVDSRHRVLTINPSAREILGLGDREAAGASVERLLPGLTAKLETLDERGSLARDELEVVREGGGARIVGVSVSPLFDHSGGFLGRVVNFQDLTDLRKMEASVRRAERLAVVGKLAAGVAHEIRNPLAAISGSIELLHQMPEVDPDSQALMTIVLREVDRLNLLLTDLLDYSNPRPLQTAELDLAELVRDTIQVFEQDKNFTKMKLEVSGLEVAATVLGDAGKLRQVVWNLLRNAAEAAGKGGGHVTVTLAQSGASAALSIADDGPGMDDASKARVFEPFFTTKSRGTGLGLATVHSLVVDHGGTVHFDSALGRGTTFTVSLPTTAAS